MGKVIRLSRCISAIALLTTAGMSRGAVVHVKNAVELARALARATGGDTILLAPGNYGPLVLADHRFTDAVTLRPSEAPLSAVMGETRLTRVAGLVFQGLDFAHPVKPDDKLQTSAVTMLDSDHVTFSHVRVHGSLDGDPRNDGFGITVEASNSISVADSELIELGRGIRLSNSVGVAVTGNRFHEIRSDGADFAACRDVTVRGNRFSDFTPVAGDHPDAIQFWTARTTTPSSNVRIMDNLIIGRLDGQMQGVFVTAQTTQSSLRYNDVAVADNLLFGTNWNGIYVAGADGVAITGNRVFTLAGSPIKFSRIVLKDVSRAEMARNHAARFLGKELAELGNADNAPADVAPDAAATAISAWDAHHPGLSN